MLRTKTGNDIKKNLAGEYARRINRVIDYIQDNLGKDLSVEELSSVANFSPFHFQRIFAAMVGEPLGKFVQRLKIERSAEMLLRNPETPVTDIAFSCGFSGSATFARAFRDYYKMSASQWRKKMLGNNSGPETKESMKCKTDSMKGKTESSLSKEFEVDSIYLSTSPFKQIWSVKMKSNEMIRTEVRVEDCPAINVAYIRHIGPYKGNSGLFADLIGRLCRWAGPRGLLNNEHKIITIYHDNPDITAEEKLRISVCLTVPEGTETGGEISSMTIPAGKYAIAGFEIDASQYQEAWNAVYAGWLPQSGYQPDDGPCFELYRNDPNHHPEKKHIFDIYVSVKPI